MRTPIQLFAVVVVLIASPAAIAMPSGTHAAIRSSARRLTALQTADQFAKIAYTWRGRWADHPHRSIGAREAGLASPRLARILRRVTVAPDMGAGQTNYSPGRGKLVAHARLSHGVRSLTLRLPIRETAPGVNTRFHHRVRLHLRRNGAGAWRVIGVRLVEATGPRKFCINDPLAEAHCNIFPAR